MTTVRSVRVLGAILFAFVLVGALGAVLVASRVQADDFFPQCADFIDNDGDGYIDFASAPGEGNLGADPDCDTPLDDSEAGVVVPVDVCENVAGDQAEGPCADEVCVEQGGTWADDICTPAETEEEPLECAEGTVPNETNTECVPAQNEEENPDTGSGSENPGGSTTNTGGSSINTDNSVNQGGVISGPLAVGYVNTSSGGGEVLGTSTASVALPALSCEPYLTSYLKVGSTDTAAVMKLQTFLNDHMSANLPVSGVFGPLTFAAVKNFQTMYAEEILAPWMPFGLSDAKAATGYVYKTTLYKINKLSCDSLDTPFPVLP